MSDIDLDAIEREARENIAVIEAEIPPDVGFEIARHDRTVLALIARVREQEQEIAKLREVVAFFACTIRSGEPWSETCRQALDECQP